MINHLKNVDVYLAPYILKYGNLIKLNNLKEIKFINLAVSFKYDLGFTISNKYELFNIKNLIKLEPNYYNSYFKEGLYYISFIVPKNKETIVKNIHDLTINYISGHNVTNLIHLFNEKAPATIKQLRLFLFFIVFVKILVYVKIFTRFFMKHLSFHIFSF